jgi:hypothetical protein
MLEININKCLGILIIKYRKLIALFFRIRLLFLLKKSLRMKLKFTQGSGFFPEALKKMDEKSLSK